MFKMYQHVFASVKIVSKIQILTQTNKRIPFKSKQDFFLLKKNTSFFNQRSHDLNKKVIAHACK